MTMLPLPGIYMIRHDTKQRAYVGSSRNVEDRCKQHLMALNRRDHVARGLQQDWEQDGPAAFTIMLLEPTFPDERVLREKETYWAERLKGLGFELYGVKVGGRPIQPGMAVPNLQRLRLRVPLSQRELAQRSGVAASTIANAEAGLEVHPATVRKLAEALKCEATALMGDQP